VQIVAPQGKADQVVQVLGTIEGVQNPQVGNIPGQPPKVVDGQVLVQATLVAPADSVEAEGSSRRSARDSTRWAPRSSSAAAPR
jgi:RND superfamily putative drug exporter